MQECRCLTMPSGLEDMMLRQVDRGAIAMGIGAMIMVVSVFIVEPWVGRRDEERRRALQVASEATPAAVAPMAAEVTIPPIVVPVDVYDRSLGNVVVEAGVFTDDLLISTSLRDGGSPVPLALCLKTEPPTPIRLEGVEDKWTMDSWVVNSRGLSCALSAVEMLSGVGDAEEKLRVLRARLVNPTGRPQKAIVIVGPYAHVMLDVPGRGAGNSYWDCDTRRGTKAEGLEGSVVGLWPRPVQDCSPITFSGFGRIEDNDCPPPCP